MFDEPINFKEAEEALAKRLDTPTALKYKEIAATWDAKARSRAFFSARVADATILSELHNRVAAVIEGKMTKTQARDLIRRYFVGEGADALAALGFAPPGDGKGLTQLASAARLKLIFDTNVKMAQEVGQYQQWQEMSHVYRYGIWKAGHAEEHRQEHLARDGKAYAYDHPIWTQSPPGGEFNCHCYRILARDEDLQERGITPEPLGSNFEASSLGFDPSRDLDPPEFGRRVRPEYRERAQEKIDAFAVGRADAVGPVFVPDTEGVRAMPIDVALEARSDIAKEIRGKVKDAIEENAKRAENLEAEAKKISAQIRDIIDKDLTAGPMPDADRDMIHRMQEERRKINAAIEKNHERLYLDTVSHLSIPNADRIQMKITMPAKSVVKDKVDGAKYVMERLTSKALGFSTDEFSVKGMAPKARSKYVSLQNTIKISSRDELPIVAHEMAHWVEYSSPHVHRRCVEFLEYRCAGEISEKLSVMTGSKFYGPHEYARKDNFFNPYCGKDYIGPGGQRVATEILSMGIQQLLEKPATFIADDPEYAAFVLLLLRGAL